MSPRTERRSHHGIQSRQQIIDATFELAHELGYTATSIAKISDRSGLPASSIYWHFENKDVLFAAVVEDSYRQWVQAVGQWDRSLDAEDLETVLSDRVETVVRSIGTSPDFWRLGLMLALEQQVVEPRARQRFIEVRARVQERAADFFRSVLAESCAGDEADLDRRSQLLARFLMATADGIFIAAQAEGPDGLADLSDLLVDALVAVSVGGAHQPD